VEWDATGKCTLCDYSNATNTGGYGINRTTGECIKNEGKNLKCKAYNVNS